MLEIKKRKQLPSGPLFGAGCDAQMYSRDTGPVVPCVLNLVVFHLLSCLRRIVVLFIWFSNIVTRSVVVSLGSMLVAIKAKRALLSGLLETVKVNMIEDRDTKKLWQHAVAFALDFAEPL